MSASDDEAGAPVAVSARPFPFTLVPGRAALVVIDMQRDFVEPGGFGASLGNDVTQLAAAIAPTRALLDAWRARGWPVVHTRESHMHLLRVLSALPVVNQRRTMLQDQI